MTRRAVFKSKPAQICVDLLNDVIGQICEDVECPGVVGVPKDFATDPEFLGQPVSLHGILIFNYKVLKIIFSERSAG